MSLASVDAVVRLMNADPALDLYTVDDLLRPDDEAHNEQVREAYARGVVATAKVPEEDV